MASPQTGQHLTEQTNLLNRFKHLFETQQYSDCVFIVEDEEFSAHRIILATISPVFEVMLYGPLAEENAINVEDIRPQEFKQLLFFAYTDKVSLESVDNAWRLLYAAKKYLINSLVYICLKYINNNLSAENVLSSYELAEMYEEPEIRNTCVDMVRKYTANVLNCDYHMLPTTLCMVLDQTNLNATEEELLCKTVSWAENECVFRNLPVAQKYKQMVLCESGALTKLRFLVLPVQYFEPHSRLCEILTDEEINEFRKLKKYTDNNDVSRQLLNGLGSNNHQRLKVPLPCHTATRWILKGASVLRINSTNNVLKTVIQSNRRVLIYGFQIPTRMATRWIINNSANNNSEDKYIESFVMSISDGRTNKSICTDTNIRGEVSHSSCMMVKLEQPVVFESNCNYQLLVRWDFEHFDLNGYEYSLDCLSTYADRKGTRFTLHSEYDFIQSISYSPYSI